MYKDHSDGVIGSPAMVHIHAAVSVVDVFHNWTVSSTPPATSVRPSGPNVVVNTPPAGPARVAVCIGRSGLDRSHSQIPPSSLPLAANSSWSGAKESE